MCSCGHKGGAVVITCSIVKITVTNCHSCGKKLREYKITAKSYSRELLISELERLHRANLKAMSGYRKLAIDFLERTMDAMPSNAELKKSLKARREDYIDRQFMKTALGDDYYR